jgi:hypothetical protein
MAITDRIDRLQRAVKEAAEKLAREPFPADDPSRPPTPGDLYVFHCATDAGLEWMIVREHPDEPDLLLAVPADDFPLVGTPDVVLPVGRSLTARYGESAWLPKRAFVSRLRVGAVPPDALVLVRRKLADLARGRISATDDQREADIDPEYEEWMDLVQQSRELLGQRLDRTPSDFGVVIPFTQLRGTPPIEFESARPRALAAESGSGLLADLGQALALAESGIRYYEFPNGDGGKLVLMAGDDGVQGVWAGLDDSVPPRLAGLNELGEPQETTWETGTLGQLRRAEPILPWIDGQVVVEIGTEPPQKLTIQT